MERAIRDKWTAALRSGKYEKCQSFLRSDHGYCCLGVLADIMRPEEWDEESSRNSGRDIYCHDHTDRMLSDEMLKAFGLRRQGASRLAGLNDSGRSFDFIAAYIERYY
jgi:hypothetical protein